MRKKKSKSLVPLFVLLIGIILIIDSAYSLLIFTSFVYVSMKYGMKISAFVVFTYIYILFKILVGILSIYISRKRI